MLPIRTVVRHTRLLLTGIFVIIIQGCASSESVKTDRISAYQLESGLGLPADAKLLSNVNSVEGREMFRDMQLALKSRNLYQTMAGDISFIQGQCPLDVVAHRGNSNFAENSRDAIRMAGVGGFDGAEIDVMLTKDKHWVVHHDLETGRATASSNGKRYRINKITQKQWKTLSGRNPDGTLNGYRPPYFSEAVNDWYHYATVDKKLNIEIKTSDVSTTDLYKLNQMAMQNLPFGNFFYSSMDMDVLKKMREVNPNVYLGYVWEPHPASIAQFKRDAKRGLNSDDYYKNNQKLIDMAFAMEGRYRKTKPRHSAKVVKNILGANSGLHVDIRSFEQHATIYQRSKAHGLKVASYTINGTDYHQSMLSSLANRGRELPDEAIMDTSKLHICQQLNPALVTSSQGYSPTTVAGEAIVSLPQDADFERLYEQLDYLDSGHYITLNGNIRMVGRSVTAAQSKPSESPNNLPKTKPAVVFHSEDEEFNLSSEAIHISLPTE
ncbi:glycerophosphodiester phosphodiesterase [Vibrio agarivorans]|uniref:glycerophosphodiester phosphodiesterase n=1 Tax=Vibrio agarivorans TaxID=153622 RepID=UPI0022305C05|nr:glycerophosphodiester phosphodiesterase family protein [Vibrio agarivorans]